MDLSRVTYLSLNLNHSDKKYQDIDSIIRLGNNSSKGLNFGKKIIYTYKEPTIDPGDFEIKIVDEVAYEDFTNFVLNFYAECFDTDFMINFHCDGFIQNPNAWQDSFLNYDYIGAPVMPPGNLNYAFIGNGGFSLRSKKLCEKVKELYNSKYRPSFMTASDGLQVATSIEGHKEYANEDVYIGLVCKNILEEYGFKFPTMEIAGQFSTEHFYVSNKGHLSVDFSIMTDSFGFHEIESLHEGVPQIRQFREAIQNKLANDN